MQNTNSIESILFFILATKNHITYLPLKTQPTRLKNCYIQKYAISQLIFNSNNHIDNLIVKTIKSKIKPKIAHFHQKFIPKSNYHYMHHLVKVIFNTYTTIHHN